MEARAFLLRNLDRQASHITHDSNVSYFAHLAGILSMLHSASYPGVHMVLRAGSLYTWRPHSTPAVRWRRTFAVTSPARLKSSELKVSSNSDTSRILTEATQLVDNGHWRLCDHGEGLERGFKFKTFAATWVCYCAARSHSASRRQHERLTGTCRTS